MAGPYGDVQFRGHNPAGTFESKDAARKRHLFVVIGLGPGNWQDDNAPAFRQYRYDDATPIFDPFEKASVALMLPEKRKLDDIALLRGACISR